DAGRVDTIPSFIYRLATGSPSRGNEASAIALVLVVITLLITFFQNRMLKNRNFTTVSGKGFKPSRLRLGRWKNIALIFCGGYFFLAVILPLIALLIVALRTSPYMASFATLFQPGALGGKWFGEVFTSPLIGNATVVSIIVGVVAAGLG